MAQSILRLEQIMRNQGGAIPLWTKVADWTDAIVLVANTAQTYALKTSTITDGGVSVVHRGSLLRINADKGPVYMNVRTTATVPAATTTDGSSSIDIIPQTAGGTAYIIWPGHDLSFICAVGCVLTIEAFD